VQIRSALFWDVGSYRRVLDCLTLDTGADRWSRNFSNRPSTLRNILEERRPQLITCYQDVIFKEILFLSIGDVLHFAAVCSRLFSKLFFQHESLHAHSTRVGCALLLLGKGRAT
jgi:hypothetical protein